VVAAASPTRPLASFHQSPALWAVPLLALLLLLFTGIANLYGQRRLAFGASVASILALLLTGVAATFPALVRAIDPAHSLTLSNASSSETALHAMLIVALVGMPIVLAYTFWLYRTFRGPVSHHPEARH
jgi:cytochrome d ubiquinol oxidase subunit II